MRSFSLKHHTAKLPVPKSKWTDHNSSLMLFFTVGYEVQHAQVSDNVTPIPGQLSVHPIFAQREGVKIKANQESKQTH